MESSNLLRVSECPLVGTASEDWRGQMLSTLLQPAPLSGRLLAYSEGRALLAFPCRKNHRWIAPPVTTSISCGSDSNPRAADCPRISLCGCLNGGPERYVCTLTSVTCQGERGVIGEVRLGSWIVWQCPLSLMAGVCSFKRQPEGRRKPWRVGRAESATTSPKPGSASRI